MCHAEDTWTLEIRDLDSRPGLAVFFPREKSLEAFKVSCQNLLESLEDREPTLELEPPEPKAEPEPCHRLKLCCNVQKSLSPDEPSEPKTGTARTLKTVTSLN